MADRVDAVRLVFDEAWNRGQFKLLGEALATEFTYHVGGQTRQALGDLDRWLAMCGSDKSHILQVVIWLSDIRFRDAMNAVWLVFGLVRTVPELKRFAVSVPPAACSPMSFRTFEDRPRRFACHG